MINKQKLLKAILRGIVAFVAAFAAAYGLCSCNVTRTVTTESRYYQRGDTAVNITTRTVESYDASKRY